MRNFLFLSLAVVSLSSFWTSANAKEHVQNISHSGAAAFCSKNGGGENCEFCDPSHCHIIHCYTTGANKGGCTNTVYSAGSRGSGEVRKPVGQVNGGSNGTVSTPIKHPVQIGSGLKPVVGTGDSNGGGSNSGGLNQGGYKGGGMNQGGGHRH